MADNAKATWRAKQGSVAPWGEQSLFVPGAARQMGVGSRYGSSSRSLNDDNYGGRYDFSYGYGPPLAGTGVGRYDDYGYGGGYGRGFGGGRNRFNRRRSMSGRGPMSWFGGMGGRRGSMMGRVFPSGGYNY